MFWAIARAVANRLLHEPTIRLRGLSGVRRHATLELVRELFDLHEPSERERHSGEALAGGATAELLAGAQPADDEAEAPLATVHSLQDRRRR